MTPRASFYLRFHFWQVRHAAGRCLRPRPKATFRLTHNLRRHANRQWLFASR